MRWKQYDEYDGVSIILFVHVVVYKQIALLLFWSPVHHSMGKCQWTAIYCLLILCQEQDRINDNYRGRLHASIDTHCSNKKYYIVSFKSPFCPCFSQMFVEKCTLRTPSATLMSPRLKNKNAAPADRLQSRETKTSGTRPSAHHIRALAA